MTPEPKHPSPGSALLEQLVPEWRRTLPASVPPAYFDGFIARNRAQLIERLDALYAHDIRPGREEKRPRGGPRAVAHLDRKIFNWDMAFVLGGQRYHTPYRTIEADEIVIEMRAGMSEDGHTAPRLILHVAPRDTGRLAPLDLRGEVQDARGEVLARFDWQIIAVAHFLKLSDDALARMLGIESTKAPEEQPVLQVAATSEPESTADTPAQARQDRPFIAHALLPQRWAAELALLDNMLTGGELDSVLNTRRQLEGRGVLHRRGGIFEIHSARPIEWVITPGLALYARGDYYGSGPMKALGVFGRTLHRLGYPEPEPALGPAFGVGHTRAKPRDELRRLLDTLGRRGIDPATLIAPQWIAAIELDLPIPLAPVPPEVRRLIGALSQANMSPRALERQGVAREQWDAHALPPRDAPPALYQQLLAQPLDLDAIAARLPVQLGDRHALAQEILDDMTDKKLLPHRPADAADPGHGA